MMLKCPGVLVETECRSEGLPMGIGDESSVVGVEMCNLVPSSAHSLVVLEALSVGLVWYFPQK
jgi:hypothetical protein